jgi:succinyl-diaminopimelate desuccinylase
MGVIAEEQLVDDVSAMVRRETVNPPGNEDALATYLIDRLEASPVAFDIERQPVEPDRPNVIARAGDPTQGRLLLTGHMDVVLADPPAWSGDPFTLRRDGDRLIGRGVADMKGALAAKLVATEAFRSEHETTGEVVLAFTVDEEVGNAGTKALIERGIEADGALIGEPTQRTVAIAEYGAVGYTVTVQGVSGHSGRPDRAVNAIDGLRRVLDRVEALGETVHSQEHDLFVPGPRITITQIEGGSAPNVVPGEASATIDWRILPGSGRGPADFDAQLRACIDEARLDGSPVDVSVERGFFSPGFETDRTAEIVQATRAGARAAGGDGELSGFNAGSDARFFTQAGIPTVLFGPGSVAEDAHTADESITVPALVETAETYRGVLERCLGPDA